MSWGWGCLSRFPRMCQMPAGTHWGHCHSALWAPGTPLSGLGHSCGGAGVLLGCPRIVLYGMCPPVPAARALLWYSLVGARMGALRVTGSTVPTSSTPGRQHTGRDMGLRCYPMLCHAMLNGLPCCASVLWCGCSYQIDAGNSSMWVFEVLRARSIPSQRCTAVPGVPMWGRVQQWQEAKSVAKPFGTGLTGPVPWDWTLPGASQTGEREGWGSP